MCSSDLVEEIRRLIGATTLGYLSLEGCVRAVGMHKTSFCRACFDGKYPIRIPSDVKLAKLMLEKPEPVGARATDMHADATPESDVDY